ncbi:MAG TPA: gamma-glutamylcyclotransferase family protein [Hyphomicrobiaceae bacterium]|nr:gamma-glutamylcyclotransferase family protein [Hyphomicrobiaceae bacterium]
MPEYLFVYGTLMSTAAHPMGARLAKEAVNLGPATIAGRLYDFGKWPGLRDCHDTRSIVHGEVYALNDATRSLDWLDAYEGIHPAAPTLTEYVRARRTVQLCDGRELTAWVYLYQWDVRAGRPLPEGRWRPAPTAVRSSPASEPALHRAAV